MYYSSGMNNRDFIQRVTTKGQATLPQNTWEIAPESEADFVEDKERGDIANTNNPGAKRKFHKLRGIATTNISTDKILTLTRQHPGHGHGFPLSRE